MDRQELAAALHEHGYLEGDFVLRSGRRSQYYFDKFRFETQPEVLRVLGERIATAARELEPEAVFIFLAPPSMEEQARRLFDRKTEDPQEIAHRLEEARREMHELTHFDYIVVNHSNRLDDTVRAIEAIMLAEKSRVHPRRIRLAERERSDE